MRARHSLPAVALGAVALGAALGANPAHADTPLPLPTAVPPVDGASAPQTITVEVPAVVEAQLTVPLPLPSAASLPLPSAIPLPSAASLPLPTAIPLPLPSAVSLPAPTAIPTGTPTRLSDVPPSTAALPSTTAAPPTADSSAADSPAAHVAPQPSPPPSTATVSFGGVQETSADRAPDRPRPAATVAAEPTPGPPARPRSGLPVFALAFSSAPAGTGTGGVDPPSSTAEASLFTAPLRPGATVAAVDRRATGRPVERGPPPPQHLLITQSQPRH
ncbi:hypothetical protein AB0B85_00790 [Micromonospora sp. NPDC049044]|uniref:hypothetical protein n=1 Tax=unclassified Micromonospora TaxID=2617518 RepID=UPI0033D98FEE